MPTQAIDNMLNTVIHGDNLESVEIARARIQHEQELMGLFPG